MTVCILTCGISSWGFFYLSSQLFIFFLTFLFPFSSPLFLLFFSHIFFIIHIITFFLISIVSFRADYQYNPRGSSASVKKRILITHNLRLLKIKTKDYGKGQTLHNFMLEEVIIIILVFCFVYFCYIFFFLSGMK